jgi:hypothetical protein
MLGTTHPSFASMSFSCRLLLFGLSLMFPLAMFHVSLPVEFYGNSNIYVIWYYWIKILKKKMHTQNRNIGEKSL